MASHESALKAHRQSVVRRETNRQYRSKLRRALKTIRAAVSANDVETVTNQLAETSSLIDKMSRQGHHPRQRRRPVQVADSAEPEQGRRRSSAGTASGAVSPSRSRPIPRPAARAARADLRRRSWARSVLSSASSARVGPRRDGPLDRRAQQAERHVGHGALGHFQFQLPQRRGSAPVGHFGPQLLAATRRRPPDHLGDVIAGYRLPTRRIQHDALDVGAKPGHVGPRHLAE